MNAPIQCQQCGSIAFHKLLPSTFAFNVNSGSKTDGEPVEITNESRASQPLSSKGAYLKDVVIEGCRTGIRVENAAVAGDNVTIRRTPIGIDNNNGYVNIKNYRYEDPPRKSSKQ